MGNGRMDLICRIFVVSIVVILSSGMAEAVIDVTDSYNVNFAYADFGQYKAVDFGGAKYFAGYDSSYVSSDITNSTKLGLGISQINLLENGYISNILIDSNIKYTVSTEYGIELQEGYILNIRQVDPEATKALVELTKNGKSVDTKNIFHDTIYIYEVNLGDEDNVPIIIVHVDSIFRGTDVQVMTLTGIYQISDTLTPVAPASVDNGILDPQHGSIHVLSNPSGARVYIDDIYRGITPLKLDDSFLPGSYDVKLTKTGYVDATRIADVFSDTTTVISRPLISISAPTGSIFITSDISGARVYLDGTPIGTTPLTIDGISIGTHSIKLVKYGHADKMESVTVTEDNTEKISMSLENTSLESSDSTDTRALDAINEDSDSPLKSNQKIPDNNLYSRLGAIALLLFLMGIVASNRKKSKAKRQSISANSSAIPTPTKSVSHSQDNTTEPTSTKSSATPTITSAFGYKGAT
ncbi:MAG: PEGA domain-containing protein, partial [Methanosarcinales archaeon]|nr:PEGA domain-containing protein [Methanosarcinales archaeon]